MLFSFQCERKHSLRGKKKEKKKDDYIAPEQCFAFAWDVQRGIRAPPSAVTQCGSCLFARSHLTGPKKSLDSLEFPPNPPHPDRDLFSPLLDFNMKADNAAVCVIFV